MELVGRKDQQVTLMQILPHISYKGGIVLTAGLGYFIRDYSWLQLTVAMTALPMIATYWYVSMLPPLLHTLRITKSVTWINY